MADPGLPPAVPGLSVTTNLGGVVVVASDALLTQLDALIRLGRALRLLAGDLLAVIERHEPQVSIAYDVPPVSIEARRMSNAALRSLLGASETAERLAASVRATLVEYSRTEHALVRVVHRLDENVAEVLGAEFRVFGWPMALIAAAGVLTGGAIAGRSPSALALTAQGFLKEHGRILTSATSVGVIREMASSADGFGEGFLLVPPPIADALQSSGVTGVSSSANTVVGAGRAIGLFEPSAVRVTKTSSFEFGTPPTSLVDRSTSFPRPDADPNGEQIRIDRYIQPGKPDRFDVFIAGTVTFDPITGSEPFDFQSDLAGVGQRPTASYQAVADALKQAGVTSASPVVFNGYSQGGLLASQLAASGNYNVHGVVTFGAPSAQVQIPASVPVLSIRNSDDLVPATSGYDVNPNAVVVATPAFAHGPVPSDFAVPAHELGAYQQTAALVDGSTSSEVRGVLDPLNRFAAGATKVDSTLWLATRVSPSEMHSAAVVVGTPARSGTQ